MENDLLTCSWQDILERAKAALPPETFRANNAWQCCPICDGAGRVTPIGISSATFEVCTVCRGKKIISTLNGLPPEP